MADLDDFVARIVATAPPLTEEQIDRLAVLLKPGRGTSPGAGPELAHDVISSAWRARGGRRG